ncbi:MAG TPA: 1-(5-phosphoribosyl)-5-[(5-phosphoribosylamino)methylideneamino]imidazole-4-carboxamide isomerase [Anaerohalosphaeraceae bacterium]|mgnify:CR=1 FL=1|nr:1-(5-phosphoribosyl)-5-[(5-phosphoribosylamino)methylideneamino]imidazole-4-carboxamide isomerase [Phycisphaerae bacterium]HOL32359.1 1-(5-phosphoribosyl)-5-[(5-phosphoribosylamino)methylideneamino]imidazole-4-carboxamide isomerase [Anaerohalosphaeraceae bacterium]HOM75498.1 1-(5-phosphoribosyl)-5-[(5-phosphoribosylamino)methylideneamino]imidazole-4-carboxamide isomerase [Anaerohalosphaeraceae bacterium]HPC65509.1 1-(5-phosphoribosyl)-5-[(5-phosphoribosylamino)methylideneamino]imidazole-4-car
MDILPAIDIIGGRCVRLIQGCYDRQITYRDDPAAQAAEFYQAGAVWLHLVDLDGAKAGRPVNAETVAHIAAQVPMKIELGGGIRTEEAIVQMLEAGVTRLILGSSAVKQFDWFCRMAEKYPHKLVLGLDARGSTLAAEGWLEEAAQTVLEFAKKAADLPLAAIIYTDISKDGMLAGPNIERTRQLVEAVELPVVAAGGVTTVEDVKALKRAGVAGAIIGRALYEGTIDLKAALKAAYE